MTGVRKGKQIGVQNKKEDHPVRRRMNGKNAETIVANSKNKDIDRRENRISKIERGNKDRSVGLDRSYMERRGGGDRSERYRRQLRRTG